MKSISCSTMLFISFKKLIHFSYKHWSSFFLHYFQWKTFSKSDRQEGSEPISKLNLNLFMFSLCIFVLVPKYSFSSNGYFLSLVFISLLCLKTAILFLLILHFSNLMKQVLLFIFHEEKKTFWIILFCTFLSSNSLIHLYAHFIGDREIFFVVLQKNGEKVLPYFQPLLSSGASLPFLCLQKLVTTVEI